MYEHIFVVKKKPTNIVLRHILHGNLHHAAHIVFYRLSKIPVQFFAVFAFRCVATNRKKNMEVRLVSNNFTNRFLLPLLLLFHQNSTYYFFYPICTGTDEFPTKSVVNRVATQLQKALHEKGIAFLVNHGISEEKVSD